MRLGCAYALSRLGRDAAPAREAMLRALWDTGTDLTAQATHNHLKTALAGLGKTVVPDLVEALEDPKRRFAACAVLARMGPDGAPAAEKLSLIIEERESLVVHLQALDAIERIGPAASRAVSAIVKALERKELRLSALGALRGIGPAASSAAPAIEKLLEAGSPDEKVFARQALDAVQRAPGQPNEAIRPPSREKARP